MHSAMLVVAAGFMLCSCGGKDEDTPVNPGEEYANYQYSSLTPENQKAKLATETRTMLSQFEDVQTCDGYQIYKTFGELLDKATPGGYGFVEDNDIVKLSDLYATFTWNASKQEWTRTSSSSETKFIFPVGSKEATVTITSEATGKYLPLEEDSEVEIPKKVTVIYALGGQEVGRATAETDFYQNTDKFPTTTSFSYTFCDYSLTGNISKATPNIATVSFKNGASVLIEGTVALTGNLDAAFQADEEFEKFGDANTAIKIGDGLVFVGNAKITDYSNAEQIANQQFETEYDAALEKFRNAHNTDAADAIFQQEFLAAAEKKTKAIVAAFNSYITIYLVSTADQTKIATLQYKAVKQSETWGSYTLEWWSTVPVLVFNDSTEVEASVYFSEGFEKLEQDLLDFVNQFQ